MGSFRPFPLKPDIYASPLVEAALSGESTARSRNVIVGIVAAYSAHG
jgi:hypothetical protein